MKTQIGFLALASVSALALAAPAYAQGSDSGAVVSQDPVVDSTVPGDAIVVTARRRAESVQDVPAVIDTVTAEEFEQLNIREFTEVQSLVPGLQLSNERNGLGGNAQLRGVDFNVNASGNNPTVEFYLNDAPAQANVVLQQTYDVSQVEVLRGPQGTLRGRASPSGSITVTTRRPDLYEAGGYVNATGTDIGGMNFNGAVGLPIVEGVLGLRLAGLYDENEGNRVKPVNAGTDSRDPLSRTRSGRVSALFQPLDWLRFEGIYQRIDSHQRSYDQHKTFSGDEGLVTADSGDIDIKDRRSILDEPRIIKSIYDIYNWRAEAEYAGQRLIYQGQQYELDIQSRATLDPANYLTDTDLNQINDLQNRSVSHEIRLQNEDRLFGMFDYVVGYFDYKNEPVTNLTRQEFAFNESGFGFLGGSPVATQDGTRLLIDTSTFITTGGVSHEQSIFGNLTFHLSDSTEISAGLRNIAYQNEGAIVATGSTNFVQPRPTLDENEWIYSASIKHNFSPDLMVYASTGTSWRPPVSAPVFENLTSYTRENFVDIEAEESQSYEIGMKSTFLDNRLRLNVSAFYQDFKNYPYAGGSDVFYLQDPGTADEEVGRSSLFVSAVPVEIYGVEAELGFDLTDRWSMGLVASYADGQIKDGIIPCNDLNGDGVPDGGSTPPTAAQLGADGIGTCTVSQDATSAPRFTATVQSEYSLPISNRTDGFLRGLFSFRGKSNQNPNLDFDDLKAFGLLNLYTGLRDVDGKWEVSLFGKNIFDVQKATYQNIRAGQNYTDIVGLGGGGAITAPGSYTAPYHEIRTTAPREIGVNVRFKFGAD